MLNNYMPPIIILLIGICTIFTKKPTKPIIKNPIPVARAILANSKIQIIKTKSFKNIVICDIDMG